MDSYSDQDSSRVRQLVDARGGILTHSKLAQSNDPVHKAVLGAAVAVAMMIPEDQLVRRSGAFWAQVRKFSAAEPFHNPAYGVPLSAAASAVLIAPKYLMMAGHALPPRLLDMRFVFGFTGATFQDADDELPARFVFKEDQIGEPRAIRHLSLNDKSGDIAIVELRNAVDSRFSPARVAKAPNYREGREVAMLGHPWGRPLTASCRLDNSHFPRITKSDQFPIIWSSLHRTRGYSGAPLLDECGCVIGVHGGGSGFAISLRTATHLARVDGDDDVAMASGFTEQMLKLFADLKVEVCSGSGKVGDCGS